MYGWCMTDVWDPSNPLHKDLARRIELGCAIPELRPLSKAREALISVGFEITYVEDLADRPCQVPWYYPLEGDILQAQTGWDYIVVWRRSWSGRFLTHCVLYLCEILGLVPKGSWKAGAALAAAEAALVEGGRIKLFTPMYLAVCRKPA